MRKLDLFWLSNEEWIYQVETGAFLLKDDAPKEAQESYKHYLEQKKSERGIS